MFAYHPSIMPSELTWTCHVCGQVRPNAFIGVYKSVVEIRGMEMTQNVRYCKDKPECVKGAESVSFFGK